MSAWYIKSTLTKNIYVLIKHFGVRLFEMWLLQKGKSVINLFLPYSMARNRSSNIKDTFFYFHINAPSDVMIIAGYADLSHQFTANSPQEAMEWVEQIKIVLRGKQTFLCTSFPHSYCMCSFIWRALLPLLMFLPFLCPPVWINGWRIGDVICSDSKVILSYINKIDLRWLFKSHKG